MSSNQPNLLPRLLDEHGGMLRFLFLAAFLFTSFLYVYDNYIYGSDVFVIYLEFCASVTSWALNTFLGMQTVIVETLRDVHTKILQQEGSKVFIIVARGCDASTVFAVLIATVTAWPGRWLVKLPVVLAGLTLMFMLNIMRIAGMLLVEIYNPDYFDMFHEWVLPSALVVGALLYFYVWVVFSGRHPAD
ncbi:MAG: hypothetical protein KJO24_02755 [Gammaproteobacteria bacterium]|nr:hypothetical protein [Gammaproteobacteria bacterium]